MMVKTRIFEFHSNGYRNLSELAQAMGMSVSQVYRVRQGKRRINQKFIVGAMKAFPNYKLDDLFYLVPVLPTVNNAHPHRHLTKNVLDEPAARGSQLVESTQRFSEEVKAGLTSS
ncbi:helix-turn-helix domain-containing protein [Chloroflexota bacterium]